MAKQPKIPITRANKFFAMEDFRLEVELGREYIEGDLNMNVVLYRVDREASFGDDLYGEANKDEIRFLPPVELKVISAIAEPENKTYNVEAGNLRYQEHGQLVFSVYKSQMTELEIDITVGDYIGYNLTEEDIMYYTVVNDGRIDSFNAQTMLGVKGFYRTITCAPVDRNEFRGI